MHYKNQQLEHTAVNFHAIPIGVLEKLQDDLIGSLAADSSLKLMRNALGQIGPRNFEMLLKELLNNAQGEELAILESYQLDDDLIQQVDGMSNASFNEFVSKLADDQVLMLGRSLAWKLANNHDLSILKQILENSSIEQTLKWTKSRTLETIADLAENPDLACSDLNFEEALRLTRAGVEELVVDPFVKGQMERIAEKVEEIAEWQKITTFFEKHLDSQKKQQADQDEMEGETLEVKDWN